MVTLARVGVFGAGAIGGTVGGLLALAGRDVTLIGQWREHIDAVRKNGLRMVETTGTRLAHPHILHHEELGTLTKPFDVVLLCVKSYDTEWAVKAVAPHLAPHGFVASLQNGINESRIAAIVGVERTVGVGISTIGANATEPGEVVRTSSRGGSAHTVFRVGEIDGRMTPRIAALVELLNLVDSAKATDNLMGERWSKLVINSITHGLAVVTGLNSRALMASQALRPLTIRLAAEGVRAGRAQRLKLVDIYGAEADTWLAASMLYTGEDRRRLRDLRRLAHDTCTPLIAINDVLYHAPDRRDLQDVVTCIREHMRLQDAGVRLQANAERYLKEAGEMARLFRGAPTAVEETLHFAGRISFTLDQLGQRYPREIGRAHV